MKNKKKTDLRSGAKAAAEKPISNIDKNDKAVILARMHEIKKYKDDISSTQNTIGYTQMFKDGVCQIDDHINFENNMDENPISTKSDFIISLCEIIVGGKYGLTAEERSVIDRCVRAIYMDFFRNQPSREKMPILSDLHNALVKEGEIALRVCIRRISAKNQDEYTS